MKLTDLQETKYTRGSLPQGIAFITLTYDADTALIGPFGNREQAKIFLQQSEQRVGEEEEDFEDLFGVATIIDFIEPPEKFFDALLDL